MLRCGCPAAARGGPGGRGAHDERAGGAPPAARAKALYGAGALALYQTDYGRATARMEEGLGLARRLGDRHGVATGLTGLGSAAYSQGEWARAAGLLAESVARWRELGSPAGTAFALSNLGVAQQGLGEFDRATALLEESLALYQGLGDRRGAGWALGFLALVAYRGGDPARAAAHCRECLAADAARLLAAGQALLDAAGSAVPLFLRAQQDGVAAALRAALGEAAFAAAWAEGRALPAARAVAWALGTAAALAAPASPQGGPLTAREGEVVRLVAQGRTDREVATALTITERAAARHVAHILQKLRLASRAQIGVWAAEHGLGPRAS